MDELDEKQQAIQDMFDLFDDEKKGELGPEQVQAAHEMLRIGGISMPQVKASMQYTCLEPDVCEEHEFLDLLKEMDRRYYLIQDFRWEFSMLDTSMTDSITEEQAMWFLQTVHGENFSRSKWDQFIKSRPAPGTRVSFPEIEVELCNIPCYTDVIEEIEAERKRKRELEKKKQMEREALLRAKQKQQEERQMLIDEQKRREAEKREKEEQERLRLEKERLAKEEEEERLRKEAEEKKRREEEKERRRKEKEDEELRLKAEEERLERLRKEAEEKRKREEEEAKNIEEVAKKAAEDEVQAEKAATEAAEKKKRAEDAKSKKDCEEAEAEALRLQKEAKEKRIRANLKVAIKVRKRPALRKGVDDFKKAKLKDHDGDIPKAEQLLKLAEAKEKLNNAMASRQLKDLEDAMNNVKKQGFESDLQPEMIEANNLLLRLRRLERIRAEILELKQSTVAEIRSYSSPPPIVHAVMIGTFLILGHAESETKEWKKVQALVGKTGKDGLKRRCLEYDPQTLAKKMDTSLKAKNKMAAFELDDVRDVSAGAATFYLWAFNMIEEAELIERQRIIDAEKPKED